MSEKIVHGEALLQALSMSIMLSNRTRCNAQCRFCISRTTQNCGTFEEGKIRQCGIDRLKVGMGYCQRIGATHAILTGKADPTQEDYGYVNEVIALSRQYFPLVDMHTNGFLLERSKELGPRSLRSLVESGLTDITFSIASFDANVNQGLMGIKDLPQWAIQEAVNLGLKVRCSLVLCDEGVRNFGGVMRYINIAGNLGVHAVVIREIWRPNKMLGEHEEVYYWNHRHFIDLKETMDAFKLTAKVEDNEYGLSERDPLPWGTPVYAVDGGFQDPDHGVNVTFARCDEATTGKIIKSVIHKPNGHGYRNWDSNADILY